MDFKELFGESAQKVETPIQNISEQKVETPVQETQPQNSNYEDVNVFDFININKSFGSFKLFENLTLSIPDFKNEGQFITFLGKSGCGKTQLLKIITGLSAPDSGIVKLYGKDLTSQDHIPMVFQQYSTYPWMKVIDNVALPLKLKGIPKKERYERAMELIKLVNLEDHVKKYCRYGPLSGGQLQRVSIATSLACDSKILLLDEYSSGLDYLTKSELQDLLIKIFNDKKIDRTFILVTHDLLEAIYLSNQIIIFEPNPCKIKDIVNIKFSQERTQEIKESQEFKDYQSKILSIYN